MLNKPDSLELKDSAQTQAEARPRHSPRTALEGFCSLALFSALHCPAPLSARKTTGRLRTLRDSSELYVIHRKLPSTTTERSKLANFANIATRCERFETRDLVTRAARVDQPHARLKADESGVSGPPNLTFPPHTRSRTLTHEHTRTNTHTHTHARTLTHTTDARTHQHLLQSFYCLVDDAHAVDFPDFVADVQRP